MGGYGSGWFPGLAAIGVVSGIIVILGAIMAYNETARMSLWGALILAFSLVGLFGMGGFFLGAILGVVGGILALTWKLNRWRPDSRITCRVASFKETGDSEIAHA